MAEINTKTSLSGFVASTPQLTYSEDGTPRLYMRVGQEHATRNPDGSYTKNDSTFLDLVIFNKTAERSAALFRKGDKFIAEGELKHQSYVDREGMTRETDVFEAKRIGHDAATTRYTVNRQSRTAEQTTPAVQQNPLNQAPPQQTPAGIGM